MNLFDRNQQLYIGDVVYSQPSTLGPRIQRDLQLVYIFRGSLEVAVDGETFSASAGEVFLLLPDREEIFRFADHSATCHGWCTVIRPTIDDFTRRQLQPATRPQSFSADLKTLAGMALRLGSQPRAGAQRQRDALIQAIFHQVFDQCGCYDTTALHPPHPTVDRARQLMEEKLSEPLEVEQIARQVGISPAHLIRLFRQHLRTTPKRHLWRMRTDRAAHFLRETGLTAAEIAYRTGFANPQHFSKVFKQYQNITPGALRKKTWGL